MAFDLILRNARVHGRDEVVDVGIAGGLIAAIEPGLAAEGLAQEDLRGRFLFPGFVESHIHLDKSCILDRYAADQGTLTEAIAAVSQLKRAFTEEDIYARARCTLEKAILQGTNRMRTHVEVDPRVGLRGFDAVRQLKRDYAWAIDLEICVFPQEGLLNDPGTEELLLAACENGADLIGGCPYTDTHPHRHIVRIFEIAAQYWLDVDFHLDFDLNPDWMHIEEVVKEAARNRYGGRVTVGHVTKLSAIDHVRLAEHAGQLADNGVAVTALPATDLFLMGREHGHNVPRGVAPVHRMLERGVICSLATNNVLNPFTPFGDCSLLRLANLYANVAHLLGRKQHTACFDMITALPAKLMRLTEYGIVVGKPADLVVLDCADAAAAVQEIAIPLFGLKRGRRTFSRSAGELHPPR
jgi:cytosine deaminase